MFDALAEDASFQTITPVFSGVKKGRLVRGPASGSPKAGSSGKRAPVLPDFDMTGIGLAPT